MSRYVDAEELQKNLCFSHGLNENGLLYIPFREVTKGIENATTADVEPVRHGHWINEDVYDDFAYRCSACGEDFCIFEGTPVENLFKYCPHCGAKMDEKENDE